MINNPASKNLPLIENYFQKPGAASFGGHMTGKKYRIPVFFISAIAGLLLKLVV